jgi:hypothetical protein
MEELISQFLSLCHILGSHTSPTTNLIARGTTKVAASLIRLENAWLANTTFAARQNARFEFIEWYRQHRH